MEIVLEIAQDLLIYILDTLISLLPGSPPPPLTPFSLPFTPVLRQC